MGLKLVTALFCFAFLGGCGVAYVSSSVQEVAGEHSLRVLDLTPAEVENANAMPYQPAQLPAAFSQLSAASQPRTAPRLPDPVFLPENRPNAVELRAPPPTDPGPYRIGTGDVLVVASPRGVESVEELAGLIAAQNQRQGYHVQDDGSISIPDIGRITVGGMTLTEAEDVLFQRLIEARMDPSFTLEVSEYHSQRISISGAVGTPGNVPVTSVPLYLGAVMAAAGGVTAADYDYAVINIYRDGNLYQIPVTELYSNPSLMQIRLIDGDSIFIDTSYDLSRAQAFYEQEISRNEYTRQARATAIAELQTEINIRRASLQESRTNFQNRLNFGAEQYDYAYVVGEVDQPRRFPLPFENRAVLADALLEAGGISEISGDPRHIYVLRFETANDSTRGIIAYRLDVRNAANFLMATRMELRPGDVVFVAEQPITRWNRFISQILPSVNLSDRLSN